MSSQSHKIILVGGPLDGCEHELPSQLHPGTLIKVPTPRHGWLDYKLSEDFKAGRQVANFTAPAQSDCETPV